MEAISESSGESTGTVQGGGAFSVRSCLEDNSHALIGGEGFIDVEGGQNDALGTECVAVPALGNKRGLG